MLDDGLATSIRLAAERGRPLDEVQVSKLLKLGQFDRGKVFEETGLRTTVVGAESPMCGYSLDQVRGDDAVLLLRAVREQFRALVAGLSLEDRLVLWHAFQVIAVPADIKRRSYGMLSMSWIKAHARVNWPIGGFYGLEDVRCVTLVSRRHVGHTGRPFHALDFKVHLLGSDKTTGEILVGGQNRTIAARMANFAPKGRWNKDQAALNLAHPESVEAAILLHMEIETLLTQSNWSEVVPFPATYFLFPEEDTVQPEESPEFRRALVSRVNAWLSQGRPANFPAWATIGKAVPGNVRPCRDVEALRSQIGDAAYEFAVADFWAASMKKVGGVYAVPTGFFSLSSPQRPATKAIRAVVELPTSAFRRSIISDELVWIPAVAVRDKSLRGLAGQTLWDFTGCPSGLEWMYNS
jgi:hypothetical protein